MNLVIATSIAGGLFAQTTGVRFLNWQDVQALFSQFAATADAVPQVRDADAWNAWIRERDRQIRLRIHRGIEDSISNLVLYGTSYTNLPRVPSAESATSADGELIGPARSRVQALAVALAQPQVNERLKFVRRFLAQQHVAPSAIEPTLAANLARFSIEQRGYQSKLRKAGASGDADRVLFARATLFEQRGLSVDTSLLPNYAIEDTLRALMNKSVLATGAIHRIAVIGPGLDFTDKRDGFDFYPLQTLQPFAMLDAIARLRLGDPANVRVVAFDLNPAVMEHVEVLKQRARTAKPYIVQLPRDTSAGWNQAAVAYWNHFGETIGSPVQPIPPPGGLPGVVARAVAIQPRYAGRLEGLDLDIVAQTFTPSPAARFDLVVATNILLYYGRFEQGLAMASIAGMLNSGGFFLSNTVLPAQRPQELEYLGRRSIIYDATGEYGDDVVVYRRK